MQDVATYINEIKRRRDLSNFLFFLIYKQISIISLEYLF